MSPRDVVVRAALGYVARGWYVIPLRPGEKRPAFPDHSEDGCTRRDPRCARAGRHVTWEERSTRDPDRIRRAWRLAPFGVGIVCGPSDLLVVDLDVPKPDARPLPEPWRLPGVLDGADMLCVLAERAGQPVPLDTYTVTTPSGGVQLYFTAPSGVRLGNTAKHLAPLIDTRGWGGQVVAPPTTRHDGAAYALTDDQPPTALPGWLHDLLRPTGPARTHPTSAPGSPAGGAGRVDRVSAYVRSAVEGERARVAAVHGRDTAPERGRNHTLFTAAVALGQLVATGALTGDQARAELLDAARPHLDVCAGCARDADRTITSGLTRGARQPRPLPVHPSGSAA